jgi:hypothetical protein
VIEIRMLHAAGEISVVAPSCEGACDDDSVGPSSELVRGGRPPRHPARWLTHPPHLEQPTLAIEIHPGRGFADNDMMVPEMICFCDIPTHHLKIHTGKYSQFGIAFPKAYLIRQGANLVLYVAKNSGVLRKKPAFRQPGLRKSSATLEEYAELKKQPMKREHFAFEPRGDVFEEYMHAFWELWYAKEPFEKGKAGTSVAEVLQRDKQMWSFFVTQVFGFVRCSTTLCRLTTRTPTTWSGSGGVSET